MFEYYECPKIRICKSNKKIPNNNHNLGYSTTPAAQEPNNNHNLDYSTTPAAHDTNNNLGYSTTPAAQEPNHNLDYSTTPAGNEICNTGYYKDDLSKNCVSSCPNNYYKDDSSKSCVSNCPTRYYKDDSSKSCVSNCPTGYYKDDSSKSCVSNCPTGYYKDDSSKSCVSSCPNGYYKNELNKSCVSNCPTNYFKDDLSKSCRPYCKNQILLPNNQCSNSCLKGNYLTTKKIGTSSVKMCIPCEKGSYNTDDFQINWSESIPSCIKCDPGSISKISGSFKSSDCTKCPINTYSNFDRSDCISTCPAGFYIMNGACEKCNYGTYSTNINSKSCTPCDPGKSTSSDTSTSINDCKTNIQYTLEKGIRYDAQKTPNVKTDTNIPCEIECSKDTSCIKYVYMGDKVIVSGGRGNEYQTIKGYCGIVTDSKSDKYTDSKTNTYIKNYINIRPKPTS